MEKFSVKKPFTVLVAVIMVIMLGLVSVQNMQTNLLPNVNTPYLMVVTVYPGASPERVETEVSDVLQNALTVPGVSKITATSAENYSLLLMQFVDDTDMNSALVQVSNKLDQAKSDLPETALTPSIVQYSMNMNAFMTVAVSREGSSVYDLSDFIKNTMTPYVQRKGGVSSVSSSGLVEQLVQVQLNQEKVDAINEKLLEVIDVQLADAKAQLDSAEAQIEDGRKQYETQLANYDKLVSDTINSQYSGELQDSFMLVKKQAQALLESVNQLIAVVNEPEILLLDEPLGALDLKLRKEMQLELKRLQREMNITFIYVTHDQEEALTMSDTVVVMNGGKVQQIGTPEDIYNEPKNAFVADFIGESNILNGTMVRDNVVKMYGKEFPCVDGGFAENEPVDVVIRPEDIDIVQASEGHLVGTVTGITFKGLNYDIIVEFKGFKWLIQTTDYHAVGSTIGIRLNPEDIHIMHKSEYSGMFGDYSSYSAEYDELTEDAGNEED